MAEVAPVNTLAILETMGSENDDVLIKALTNERLDQEGRYGKTEIENETANLPGTRELPNAEEKIQKLEHELERMANALQITEHENIQLKTEIALSKEKLEESSKKHEDNELHHKNLVDQTDERHRAELRSLHEKLDAKEIELTEFLKIKESYDALVLEFNNSKKKTDGIEQELQRSLDDVKKVEELHEKSHLHAEAESQRALELEKLIKLAEETTTEQQNQMGSLKDELKGLRDQISENQKVQEELELLTRELESTKISESRSKDDFIALQNLYTSTKEEFEVKASEVEDLKFKLQEETKMKESIKESSEEEVSKLTMEKEALETTVSNLTNNAVHMKELCSDLETKLKSLEELNQESRAASNAAAEEAKLQLQEIENQNMDLKGKLNVFELKSVDAEREHKEMSEKISELHGQIQEYGEKINTAESKFINAAAESQKYSDKVSELTSELEAFHAKSESLEQILKIANESERKLAEDLNSAMSEKKMFMEALDDSMKKLAEAENAANLLQEELTLTKQKLDSMENDLKVAGAKEIEIVEELSACKEAAKNSIFLKEELDQTLAKLASQELLNAELKSQVFEFKEKASESSSEKEALGEVNMQLKARIEELQECLQTVISDKEISAQQVIELQSRNVKAENDLQLAIERFTLRDLEGNELSEKVCALEKQIEIYEKQAHEAMASSLTKEAELKEMAARSKNLEEESQGLSLANSNLTQEIAAYEAKITDLNAELGVAWSEKDDAVEQLHSSKQAVEGLKERLDSETKHLQSQLSSSMDENKTICKRHEDAKNEYETKITQLEGIVEELKASAASLKSDISNLAKDIEAESQKKEKAEALLAAAAARETELRSSNEDLLREKGALNEQVVQIERESEAAKASIAELEQKLEPIIPKEKVEIRTQGSASKRRGKKKDETAITASAGTKGGLSGLFWRLLKR